MAYESLKSGRANWVHGVPPSQYQDAKANAALDVKEWTPANAVYRALEFNMTRPGVGSEPPGSGQPCLLARHGHQAPAVSTAG